MAVVNTKTNNLNAADLSGDILANAGLPLHGLGASIEVANGNSSTSTFRIARVPSSIVIHNVELAWDALGGSCAADLGIYEVAANGGAAVDADEFASAIAMASAGTWKSEMEEAAATDIAKIGQPLWQRLGFTSDPAKAYDIVATLTADSGADGTIALRLIYTTP